MELTKQQQERRTQLERMGTEDPTLIGQRGSVGPSSTTNANSNPSDEAGEEEERVDVDRLLNRFHAYCRASGAPELLVAKMDELLCSQEGRELMTAELGDELVTDFYKPKMWMVYKKFLRGVDAEFQLHVRKTPLTLEQLAATWPKGYRRLRERLHSIGNSEMVSEEDETALERYGGLKDAGELRGQRVAGVAMDEDSGESGLAKGSLPSASAAETTSMQLAQESIIEAQARALSSRPDRTERLANALAKLVHTVNALNERLNRGTKVVLFAGRRCSDRAYLLLQNLFCARHLVSYAGTSAILAAKRLDAALANANHGHEERKKQIKSLAGTHAHEQVSALNQLLSKYDDAGPVTPLLAHLLFFAVHGVEEATALPDTFGTHAFVRAAACARLPDEFIEDIESKFGARVARGTTLLQILRFWRIDSGDYATLAEDVVNVYREQGMDPPRFMHSNIDSLEALFKATSLPEPIRPTAFGMGSLLDGFLPFGKIAGKEERLGLASLVMKCVQAFPRDSGLTEQLQPLACAGKVSDDDGKEQADSRFSPEKREELFRLWRSMRNARSFDPSALSSRLAAAYNAVARLGILNGHPPSG